MVAEKKQLSKILITGGAGFIGGHLAHALIKSGNEVHIADSFARGVQDYFIQALANQGVQVHKADLLNSADWDKLGNDFDTIIHLAAIIGVQHVLRQPYSVLRDNVVLTDHAIRFAGKQKSLQRFLFASTSEVMAGSLLHLQMPLPTPESFPIALPALSEPRTSYMLSKIYGEAMCNHSGLPFVIVRPHNIYGPRMGLSHVVPELLKKVYNMQDGDVLEVASMQHSRAMCYIDDAVQLILRLISVPQAMGGTFNLGNQETEITMENLAKIIVQTVGRKVTIAPLPDTPGSPARRCPDMTLTIKATGYQPATTIEAGVQATYQWYLENVFLGAGVSAL